MKIVLTNVLSLILFNASVLADAEIKSPSDFRTKKGILLPTVEFVSYWSDDLRLLFCSSKVLLEREKNSVCVVDNYGAYKELEIGRSENIASILKRFDARLFKNCYLRVIRRNSIEQISLGQASQEDREAFLARKISPGDFLVIAALIENPRTRAQLY